MNANKNRNVQIFESYNSESLVRALIDLYSFTRLENSMGANLTSSTSLVLNASDMDTFKNKCK